MFHMRALVTGGTGFLGGHLVSALRAQHNNVVAMGRDGVKCQALAATGIKTVQAALTDRAAVLHACKDIDVVFHVGAMSTPWGSYDDFHAANVVGTRNVIDGCLEHRVSRLVHVSSPSVTFHNRDQFAVDESTPYPPHFLSAYSSTKKLAEDLVNQTRDKLSVVIIRPKAIFGPGDNSLLPRIIAAARAGRLRQIGDGSNLVDLTYVENVVRALLLAADKTAAAGRTYYITNGEHILLWPLLRTVIAAHGCNANLRALPFSLAYMMAAFMELRAWRTGVEPPLTRYAVATLARTQTYNIAAARRDLGYIPSLSVEDGVKATLSHLGA
jgi:nucleoside-diphosphate-sugar epimerase